MPTSEFWAIRLTSEADRDLKRLPPPWKDKVSAVLRKLRENPLAGELLTQNLSPARVLKFSLPGGEYRAAYAVSDKKCVVFLVAPRENFYRMAARRLASLKKRDPV